MKQPAVVAVVVVTLVALACQGEACIYKLGSALDSIATHPGGTEWGYGFHGDDWTGVTAAGAPWVCLTGKKQSPINIPPIDQINSTVGPKLQTTWAYPNLVSNGSNIEVINNGHTIQIEWLSAYAANTTVAVPASAVNTSLVTSVLTMGAKVPATHVQAVPLQFHFHSHSEHVFQGKQYPLELHIVHNIRNTSLPACGSGGCFAVIGIPFELTDGPDNPLLTPIWNSMPVREGEIKFMPAGQVVNLNAMLPASGHYITYEGSLTTPPCTEGLLWHVFTQAQTISKSQLKKYMTAVGFKDCVAKNATAAHHHHHRRMLTEEVHNPDDYNCTVVAYGYSYRTSQDLNGRVIRKCKGHLL